MASMDEAEELDSKLSITTGLWFGGRLLLYVVLSFDPAC
jgi:hypothetical protein